MELFSVAEAAITYKGEVIGALFDMEIKAKREERKLTGAMGVGKPQVAVGSPFYEIRIGRIVVSEAGTKTDILAWIDEDKEGKVAIGISGVGMKRYTFQNCKWLQYHLKIEGKKPVVTQAVFMSTELIQG